MKTNFHQLDTNVVLGYSLNPLHSKLLDKDIDYPSFKHDGDSGFDIRAVSSGTIPGIKSVIQGNYGDIYGVVNTGLSFDIPYGYELQIRMRSGLAYNYGLTIVNGVGTIDSNYTGEVKLIIGNLGSYDFHYQVGDRLAQGVLVKLPSTTLVNKSVDKSTDRGNNGFGSTGVK